MTQIDLYPYQHDGAAFLASRYSAVLADEMGLGKTYQALAAARRVGARRILVVCPAVLKVHWARSLEVFGFQAQIMHGTRGDTPPADVAVVNYDILHAHAETIAIFPWDLVVCDECHRLKNRTARMTRAFHSLRAAFPRAWFLSGTPMLNRPEELYTVLRFCGWQVDYMAYCRRYCAARRRVIRGKRVWDMSGASNLDELRDRIRPVFLRREKKDVLPDLPPISHVIVPVEVADRYAEVAKRYGNADYETAVARLSGKAKAQALADYARAAREQGLEKAPDAALFAHDALSSGPLLVFCWHRDVVDVISEGLTRLGWKTATITGSTPHKVRQAAVDRFQAGRLDVIVGNLRAMGEGLTLTRASRVLFAEISFVPSQQAQAAARVHRIGQTVPVTAYYLVADGTLDAVQARACVRKQQVIDRVIKEDRT